MELRWPDLAALPGYRAALERGWSPDNERGEEAAREELARIAEDPLAFVRSLVDPQARGGPVKLPDGSLVPRLPGYRRWMWDGEFCGSISLRWQEGSAALPPYCLGHIGYAVVPWKRGQGHAKQALRETLAAARAKGMPYVEITTDLDNAPSRKVILANGGVLVEELDKPAQYRAGKLLRFRIELA